MLSRLRIRGKLAVLLIAPLIAVVLLTVIVVVDRVGQAGRAADTARTARVAGDVGALIQDLQQERLMAVGYLVQAVVPIQPILGSNRRPRHLSRTSTAGVAAGSTDLHLVLPESEAIAGAVVGPNGRPVPFASVSFRGEGAFPPPQRTDRAQRADREGRFLLWVEEGVRGTLDVRPPSWPVRDRFGRVDWSYIVTLKDVPAGAKDLLVRMPKVP